LPFGHVAAASNCAAVGRGEELSDGTLSLPFLGDRLPVVVGAVWTEPWTGTRLPPLLVHVTVAVYVVTNDPVAFVLPTPASSNVLHVTNIVVASAEQPIVPVWRCVPVGAFAGLMVVVEVADAAVANPMITASGAIKRKRIRRNTFVSSCELSVVPSPAHSPCGRADAL
jgi:hypothetical protein